MEDALDFLHDEPKPLARSGAPEPRTEKDAKIPLSRCEDNCNKLLFRDICERFERADKTKGTDNKFKAFFDRWMKDKIGGQSIFPVMRLLLPLNDNERGKYLIKQATVARLYVNALSLDKKNSTAAQSLIHWKDPTKVKSLSGDFGAVLDGVLSTRARIEPSEITVGEVNQILDSLAAAHGESEKVVIIRDRIYKQFCSNEQKWLMRIVFQDMKVGLKHDAVLSRLSKTALQRYNQCTNLRTVCEEEGSGVQLNGVQVNSIFRPMLAKGFSNAGSVARQVTLCEGSMRSHPFVMDVKLDGERMLAHIKDGEVKLVTRNQNDYTNSYRPLAEYIKRSVNVSDCILDGEVLAYDKESDCYLPFGQNRTVADSEKAAYDASKGEAGWDRGLTQWLAYVVFDIVYVDGPGAQAIISTALNLSHGGQAPGTTAAAAGAAAGAGAGSSSASTPLRKRQDQMVTPLSVKKRAFAAAVGGGLSGAAATAAATAGAGAAQGGGDGDDDAAGEGELGGEISGLPLAVRRRILMDVVRTVPGHVQHVRSQIVSSSDLYTRASQLEEFFVKMTQSGEEGLVVKDLLSPYVLAERTKMWVKMKPDYSNMAADLDLIVLGVYHGEGVGFRGKGLYTLLLGAKATMSEGERESAGAADKDKDKDENGDDENSAEAIAERVRNTRYETVTKMGSGYTFDVLQDLREHLKSIVKPYDYQRPPPHLKHWNPKVDDRPSYYIPPEDSFVVTIKCGELVPSAAFTAGITCRFPRLVQLRYDKPLTDILSVPELREIKERPVSALQDDDDEAEKEKKQKKKPAAAAAKKRLENNTVDSAFLLRDVKVAREGSLFEGMIFCVLTPDFTLDEETLGSLRKLSEGREKSAVAIKKTYSREELLDLVRKQAAEVTANPSAVTTVIAGKTRPIQIARLIETNLCDIIDFSYILRCIVAGERLPLKSVHYIGMSLATKKQLEGQIDELGDSYIDEVEPHELAKIFYNMDARINAMQKKTAADSVTKPAASTSATAAASKKRKQVDAVETENDLLKKAKSDARTKRETSLLLADYSSLKNKCWQEMCLGLLAASDSDDERDLLNIPQNALWMPQFIVYPDIYDELGELSFDPISSASSWDRSRPISSSASPALRALTARLRLQGTMVTSSLHVGVTHIVVSSEGNQEERRAAIIRRIEDIRAVGSGTVPTIVDMEWAESRLREGIRDSSAAAAEDGDEFSYLTVTV